MGAKLDSQACSKGSLVTKANALIGASYRLSLIEQRIILACASQLDGRKPLPKDNKFTVTVESFASMFDVPLNSAYKYLEEAADKLYERDIKRIDGKVRQRMRWVYMAEYKSGEGKIVLGFSPEIAPHLTLLHRRFTSYRLSDVAGLSSTYSIRLFEMLMQYQDTGIFSVSLDDLRECLQVSDKYPRFSNFKQRVIETAVNELTEKTSLDVAWTPYKKGRTVDRLEFRFEDKAQIRLL